MTPLSSSSASARHQRGGTLLGFVIGVVVGLAIALVVAVYVTRVPIPFVERSLSRTAEQDAQEAERNKGWNPNSVLGGQETTVAPPPEPPAQPGVTAQPESGNATEGDPLGDFVRSRTASTSPSADGLVNQSDPYTYFVQAGAFSSAGDAENQRARLGMMGMVAGVSERSQDGRTVYRVRIGPFEEKSMADATREQLVVNGVDAVLVRLRR
ncbi:SPOR domain-containing protein [Hydrogenophaga sp. 5NK40-0174]|uniref:SPOR domain-containing protein n=1 Tax=Hydrogenophaga sp. 5NK40-0174 TaxID=3127649 RepID=UPI0031030C0A